MSGRPLLTFTCQHYDASTAYHVVRRLLRQLLELPSDGGDDAVADQFLATVAERAPVVLPWAPLIARAIGVPVAETDETRELDEEFRRPRLARAVLDLLAGLLPASGLLCIDDAHFMDEASADLFGYLAESVGLTSWLICFARRDVDIGFIAPDGSSIRIEVGPLEPDDVVELARTVSADQALSPRALDTWSTVRAATRSSSGSCWPPPGRAATSTSCPTPSTTWSPPASTASRATTGSCSASSRSSARPSRSTWPGTCSTSCPTCPTRCGGDWTSSSSATVRSAASTTDCSGTAPTTDCRSVNAAGSTSGPRRSVDRPPGRRAAARAAVVPLPQRPALRGGLGVLARGGRPGRRRSTPTSRRPNSTSVRSWPAGGSTR